MGCVSDENKSIIEDVSDLGKVEDVKMGYEDLRISFFLFYSRIGC